MRLTIFHFEQWLRRQSDAKRKEVNDQVDRGGEPVWDEDAQTYIVIFCESDKPDSQGE